MLLKVSFSAGSKQKLAAKAAQLARIVKPLGGECIAEDQGGKAAQCEYEIPDDNGAVCVLALTQAGYAVEDIS